MSSGIPFQSRLPSTSSSASSASTQAAQTRSRYASDPSDAQRFEQCLRDTQHRQSDNPESDNESELSSAMYDDSQFGSDLMTDEMTPLSAWDDADSEADESLSGQGHSEVASSGELALFNTPEQAGQAGQDVVSLGHMVTMNAAVAAIIAEFQQRTRRTEQRSWQFSLEGLFDQPIVVKLECSAENEWHVQVDANDVCEEQDVIQLLEQLESRLAEQTDQTRDRL